MKLTVREAALKLVSSLGLPPGVVNAATSVDSSGPLIKLVVGPSANLTPNQVPSSIEGYRVKVERRGELFPSKALTPSP